MCEAETRMRYCETGAILKTVLFFKFYFHMILYPFCIGFSVEIHGIGSDFSVSIEKGYFLSVTVTSSLFPTKADFNLESVYTKAKLIIVVFYFGLNSDIDHFIFCQLVSIYVVDLINYC